LGLTVYVIYRSFWIVVAKFTAQKT
jgi:hypothetical protein